jgi:hypothetical protein
MKALGCLFVLSLATALKVQRDVEEPLKPCKGKEAGKGANVRKHHAMRR